MQDHEWESLWETSQADSVVGKRAVQVYSQELVFWHHHCVNALDPCDCRAEGPLYKCLPEETRSRAKETQVAVLMARWTMCLGLQFMEIVRGPW